MTALLTPGQRSAADLEVRISLQALSAASDFVWDAIVVGAGPAGMNAALVLGRCRRRVLVLDNERPRNHASHAMHGFLGHDGVDPQRFRSIARAELGSYPSVFVQEATVSEASKDDGTFWLRAVDGKIFKARKLLLASGVVDELPSATGFRELFGKGVFLCPYCDGWEVRDQALAVYGRGDDKGGGLAIEMKQWSADVVLCSDGPSGLSAACRSRLARHNIIVREDKIAGLQIHSDEPYRASFDVVFESSARLRRAALFFNTHRHQSTDLAAQLGCKGYASEGCEIDNRQQASSIPGLYIAGDASRDVLQVVVAASEGAQAAIAINTALIEEDFV